MKAKRGLLTLLALCLCLVLPGVSAGAATGDGTTLWNALQEVSEEKEPRRMGEMTSLRERNAKTWLREDGSRECVVSSEPVHYARGGEWLEIDNTLLREEARLESGVYAWRNRANGYTLRLGETWGENALRVETEKGWLTLGSAGAASGESLKEAPKGLEGRIDPAASLLYRETAPGVSLLCEAGSGGTRVYFVLDRRPEEDTLTLQLTTGGGLEAKDTGEGVRITDAAGEETFVLDNWCAWDARGNALPFTGRLEGDTLLLPLDSGFLDAAAYPVVVDPYVMVSGANVTADAHVFSALPNTNFYLNDRMPIGITSAGGGTFRTYIRFTLPTNIPSNAVIGNVWLRMARDVTTNPSVTANRVTGSWTSSGLLWSNKPNYTTTNAATALRIDTLYNGSYTWIRMNIKEIYKAWRAGTYPNYGVCLKDPSEASVRSTTVYSSDAASPNKPELVIIYTERYGARPYETASGASPNCAGYALRTYLANNVGNEGDNEPNTKVNFDTSYLPNIVYEDFNVVDFDILDTNVNSWGNTSGIFSNTHIFANAWMEKWLNQFNGWSILSTYNDPELTGYYRCVLRVGYIDRSVDSNGNIGGANGIVEYSANDNTIDLYDYHLWYQTDTGQWAEKSGSTPSRLIPGTSSSTNPASCSWMYSLYSTTLPFYTSSCWYYQVKYPLN